MALDGSSAVRAVHPLDGQADEGLGRPLVAVARRRGALPRRRVSCSVFLQRPRPLGLSGFLPTRFRRLLGRIGGNFRCEGMHTIRRHDSHLEIRVVQGVQQVIQAHARRIVGHLGSLIA